MSRTEKKRKIVHATPIDTSWEKMYLIGGVMALFALMGTLIDISLTMVPGWEITTVPTTILGWFTQFQAKPFLGLRNLDLLNAFILFIQIPMFLALYGVHRKTNQAFAALALIVCLLGTFLFISNNAALPMLGFSRQYFLASTESQKLSIEGASLALLAKGAHGSMGAFIGFFMSSIGTLMISFVMLQGKIFSRVAAWTGIMGITSLILYTVGNTFMPNAGEKMLIIAMPGGILMIVWNVMVARKLFQLSSGK